MPQHLVTLAELQQWHLFYSVCLALCPLFLFFCCCTSPLPSPIACLFNYPTLHPTLSFSCHLLPFPSPLYTDCNLSCCFDYHFKLSVLFQVWLNFFFFFNWDGFCKHKIIAIKAGREKWHTGLKYSVSHGFFSRYVGFHWNLGWPLER